MTLTGPERTPKSGNPPKQLVIFLHGLGSNGQDLIGLAPSFAATLPDAHFISPDAPFPCDLFPYGHQWFSLRSWDPSAMLKGVRVAEPLLNAFIDAQLKRFGLQDNQLILVGFSQGTIMALYTALRRVKPCAGVLGYSGLLIGEEFLADEIKSRPPVCLVHGTFDNVVPYTLLHHAEMALSQHEITVEAHTRHGIGHGIDAEGMEIGKVFLKRVTNM